METIAVVLILFTAIAFIIALFSLFRKPKEKTWFHKDVDELSKSVKKLEEEGFGEEEIVKKLVDVGWKEHIVELVLHEAHKPTDKIEKLQNYVKSQILKAKSKERIKETLLEAGWSEDIIDVVLGLE